MGIAELIEVAKSEVVFAVLFIISLIAVGKWVVEFIQSVREENSTREDQLLELHEKQAEKSAVREEKLMVHLERTTDQLERMTDTQVQMQESMGKLEQKIDQGLTEVWKELGGKVDKSPPQ
ncbi:hypothetical protein [Bacillus phage Anath]|uniref:Uncharacterized protein n=1 Tax=Bacillus phage Anath TaxID=2108114 RepID=A0A2P1JUM4_9CAUD|nr:hypothetical protein [Bacillus phage Anath]